jgi:hypothetical protein
MDKETIWVEDKQGKRKYTTNKGDIWVHNKEGERKYVTERKPVLDKDGEQVADDNGKKLWKKETKPKIWKKEINLIKPHSFCIWNKDCFSQFPPHVRKKFSRHVFGLAHDDEPMNLPSPSLALQVLDTKNNFSALEDTLQQSFELIEQNAISAYHCFVEYEGQTYFDTRTVVEKMDPKSVNTSPVITWPAFDRATFRKDFGPPKKDGIATIFWVSYNMIKPYLDRDLCSRLPGRILRWDATYEAAVEPKGIQSTHQSAALHGWIYDSRRGPAACEDCQQATG